MKALKKAAIGAAAAFAATAIAIPAAPIHAAQPAGIKKISYDGGSATPEKARDLSRTQYDAVVHYNGVVDADLIVEIAVEELGIKAIALSGAPFPGEALLFVGGKFINTYTQDQINGGELGSAIERHVKSKGAQAAPSAGR